MMETIEQVRERLVMAAEARLTQRLQNATSVGSSDAALRDHKFALDRIYKRTDAELLKLAIEKTPTTN